MKEVAVSPRTIRRVSRIYLSEFRDGLKAKQPFGDFYIYVHYDPENKLYFAGSINKVYAYTYSNSFDFIVKFVVKQLCKRFPLIMQITRSLGEEGTQLITSKYCTIDELAQVSQKDKQTIGKWLADFPGVMVEKKNKSYKYHIKPLYPQLMHIHNIKEKEYDLK